MCLEFYESIHMALILVNLRLLVIKQRVQLCSYKLGKKQREGSGAEEGLRIIQKIITSTSQPSAALLDLSNLLVVATTEKKGKPKSLWYKPQYFQEIDTRVLGVVKHFIDVTCLVWLKFGRGFRLSFYSARFLAA